LNSLIIPTNILSSNKPPTPLKYLDTVHIKTAYYKFLSFYEYTADLKGLPENLNATTNIIIKTTEGAAKFKYSNYYEKKEAYITENK
jgi:hypothetical protein